MISIFSCDTQHGHCISALPAIVLAHAGRHPRVALAFALAFLLLCVGPYLLDRAGLF